MFLEHYIGMKEVREAQSFCFELSKHYWKAAKKRTGTHWRIRDLSIDLPKLKKEKELEVIELSKTLTKLSPEDAGYQISVIYQNRLPKRYRDKLGVFYTPKNVVERMLKDADCLNVNFKTARIIDPSSGGAAYLAPLCRKMITASGAKKELLIEDIEKRLVGIEIDVFAGWLSQLLVDCVIAEYTPNERKPNRVVINGDSLQVGRKLYGSFDYVIGNPPYGVIGKDNCRLEAYESVISGKANLYQLFFATGMYFLKRGGCLHFITPTGFLGGKYFNHLRFFMERESYPKFFQFFEDRSSVFEGVQQEVVISAFKKGRSNKLPKCTLLVESEADKSLIEKFWTISPYFENGVWVLPKSEQEEEVSKLFSRSKVNLEELGFVVRTGSLVPHRSLDLISHKKLSPKSVPIIWSESISEGSVKFNVPPESRRDKWYRPVSDIGIIKEPCIVVKRTSSKEQKRRIQSGYISQNMIEENNGFIAENHVNVILKITDSKLRVSTIGKFLRSSIFEDLFKCSSGTVTVSATELRRIPMPSYDGMLYFQNMVSRSSSTELINEAAEMAYGI